MAESGNVLSRNPNVCASCSSLADGLEESASALPIEPAPPAAVPERVVRETQTPNGDSVPTAALGRG